MNKFTLFLAVALSTAAAAAAPIASQPVLAGTVHVAGIGPLSASAAALGQLIGNPMMPAAMVAGLQQQLARTYGPARPDASGVFLLYVDTPAFDVSATNDIPTNPMTLLHDAVVYPLAHDLAAFTNAHPSAVVKDGAVHLLPAPGRAEDTYVVFGPKGYAAFAPSADLARQALKDAEPVLARPLEGDAVSAQVLSRGLSAWMLTQESQAEAASAALGTNKAEAAFVLQSVKARREVLSQLASCTLSLGVSASGIVLRGGATARPGAPMAAAFAETPALDSKAFDQLAAPANAPFFFAAASSPRLQALSTQFSGVDKDGTGAFKFLASQLRGTCPAFADAIATQGPALVAAGGNAPTLVSETGYLAFDAARHPMLVSRTRDPNAATCLAMFGKAVDALMAAAAKDWPGQKVFTAIAAPKGDLAFRFDLGELIAAFRNADKKPLGTNDVAEMKRVLNAYLGGTALICRLSKTPDGLESVFSGEKTVLPAPAPAAASRARLDGLLPELAKGPQPLGAGWFSFVAIARPILQNYVSTLPSDAAAFSAPVLATIPEQPGKGIGCAGWCRKDGSLDFVVRVSADEIRGMGAVIGVISGLSVKHDASGSSSEEEDDGGDDEDEL